MTDIDRLKKEPIPHDGAPEEYLLNFANLANLKVRAAGTASSVNAADGESAEDIESIEMMFDVFPGGGDGAMQEASPSSEKKIDA